MLGWLCAGGGAVQLTGITKSATFVNETYGDNKASANGGAIYVTKSASASKLSITDSSLKARFPPSPSHPHAHAHNRTQVALARCKPLLRIRPAREFWCRFLASINRRREAAGQRAVRGAGQCCCRRGRRRGDGRQCWRDAHNEGNHAVKQPGDRW